MARGLGTPALGNDISVFPETEISHICDQSCLHIGAPIKTLNTEASLVDSTPCILSNINVGREMHPDSMGTYFYIKHVEERKWMQTVLGLRYYS